MSVMANLTLVYDSGSSLKAKLLKSRTQRYSWLSGHKAHVTMHMIEGSREEIEAQLKRSLDAFSISTRRSEDGTFGPRTIAL